MQTVLILLLTHVLALIVGVVGGYVYRGKIKKELDRGGG